MVGASDVATAEFAGTDRFQIVRRIGGGGMGVVYEAIDKKTGTRVALKTMRSPSARALLRFKNEFRALADLHHPNLVQLKELIEERGQWFFTMELVQGCDFLRWVWQTEPPPPHDTLVNAALLVTDPSAPLPMLDAEAVTAPMPSGMMEAARFSDGRLRAAFAQLVEGLTALHRAGHVHRDIKPSNVLVTHEGRVVILDFGLVTPLLAEGDGHTRRSSVAGTFAYMAPEHAGGLRVSEAADWYSAGVVLYQALTGRLPFATPAVLAGTAVREATPPRSVDPRVPADLDQLCVDLLSRAPELRPGPKEILRWLRVAPSTIEPRAAPAAFVGRRRELRLIHELVATRADEARGMVVEGASGVGKSALLQEAAAQLCREEPPALVLASRCRERESLPFKAIDGIVDGLSRHMARLPDPEVAALLPRRIGALAQIFPVLLRVEAVARAPRARDALSASDPHERRGLAFLALKELLARLADRAPLVLAIDDMQWADDDSLALLAEVTRPPDAPALVLLFGLRETPGALDAAALTKHVGLPLQRVPLEPLGADEARALARAHLGASADAAAVDVVVAESGGHPLFIGELARHAQGGQHAPTLEAALGARVAELSADEQALLEALALAGRPLPIDTLRVVLDRAHGAIEAAVSSLVSARLASLGGDRLETFHDRVAQVVLQRLAPAAARQWHERLASALEASGRADPEMLAAHWLGAGRDERAATLLMQAASEAADALAFERAARLYQQLLERLPPDSDERAGLSRQLGDALSAAGRIVDAAEAYRAAAALAAGAARIDLLRCAAECFLRAGCIDDGMAAQKEVLALVGMRLPRRPLAALLAARARLRLRGLRFRPRDAAEIAPEQLLRVDVVGSAGNGTAVVDPLLAALFQTRHLLLALAAGEPGRISQALVIEAIATAARGGRARRRVAPLLVEATQLAEALPDEKPKALALAGAGMAALLGGDWATAAGHSDAAAERLRERCDGVGWELGSVELFALIGRIYQGRFAELVAWLPTALQKADARGDLHTMVSFRTGHAALVALADDAPARARRDVESAGAARQQRWVMQRAYFDLYAGAHIDLYEDAVEAARARLADGWPALERSYLLHLEFIRVIMLDLRARTALAAARPEEALADARAMVRSGAAWAEPLAALVRAGAAAIASANAADGARADDELTAAERGFRAHGMLLHAAVAQRRRGERAAGDDGRRLRAEADEWMRGQAIRVPARFVRMLAPGFAASPD